MNRQPSHRLRPAGRVGGGPSVDTEPSRKCAGEPEEARWPTSSSKRSRAERTRNAHRPSPSHRHARPVPLALLPPNGTTPQTTSGQTPSLQSPGGSRSLAPPGPLPKLVKLLQGLASSPVHPLHDGRGRDGNSRATLGRHDAVGAVARLFVDGLVVEYGHEDHPRRGKRDI